MLAARFCNTDTKASRLFRLLTATFNVAINFLLCSDKSDIGSTFLKLACTNYFRCSLIAMSFPLYCFMGKY
jgi:hypothetical protein